MCLIAWIGYSSIFLEEGVFLKYFESPKPYFSSDENKIFELYVDTYLKGSLIIIRVRKTGP